MPKIIHNTRKDSLYSATTPIGNLVPAFIGQQCITAKDEVFFAKGLTNKDWISAGNTSEIQNKIAAVEGEVESLKQSVVNGKSVVAGAITDKGVPTPANADFIVIANNIKAISGGIDMIATSSLPSTVKNDQYVIITPTKPNKIFVSHRDETLSQNDVLVKIASSDKDFPHITMSDISLKLPIGYTKQNNVLLETYIGQNGKWVKITSGQCELIKDGIINNAHVGALTADPSAYGTITTTDGILSLYSNSSSNVIFISDNKIDVTDFSNLTFNFEESRMNDSYGTYVKVGLCSQRNYTSYIAEKTYQGSISLYVPKGPATVNVSNVTGSAYLIFEISKGGTIKVVDTTLT